MWWVLRDDDLWGGPLSEAKLCSQRLFPAFWKIAASVCKEQEHLSWTGATDFCMIIRDASTTYGKQSTDAASKEPELPLTALTMRGEGQSQAKGKLLIVGRADPRAEPSSWAVLFILGQECWKSHHGILFSQFFPHFFLFFSVPHF